MVLGTFVETSRRRVDAGHEGFDASLGVAAREVGLELGLEHPAARTALVGVLRGQLGVDLVRGFPVVVRAERAGQRERGDVVVGVRREQTDGLVVAREHPHAEPLAQTGVAFFLEAFDERREGAQRAIVRIDLGAAHVELREVRILDTKQVEGGHVARVVAHRRSGRRDLGGLVRVVGHKALRTQGLGASTGLVSWGAPNVEEMDRVSIKGEDHTPSLPPESNPATEPG